MSASVRLFGVRRFAAVALLSAGFGGVGFAQDAGQPAPNPGTDPGYAPAIRYPDQGFTFMRHSSTVAEGAFRGAADYVRAVGQANLDNSLAAMNYQEAVRRSLENSLKYAETYYARRDLWFDYQEEHQRKPLTMEGYRKLSEAAGAPRLAPEQFDAQTGHVRWPDLLQAKVLEPYRVRIDQALATRSNDDYGFGSKAYEEVRSMSEAMQEILDRNRKAVPSHLYVHATQFLRSVAFEARFAPASKADDAAPAVQPEDAGQPVAPPAPAVPNS